MQQGRHRRRCDGSRGQPAGQRQHRRLDPESKESEHAQRAEPFVFRGGRAGRAVEPAHAEGVQPGHGDKAQGSSADQEQQVAHRRPFGCRVPRVPYQRHRTQRQPFICHVERKEVVRRSKQDRRRVRSGIPGEEVPLPFFMVHVFSGIEHGQGPQHRGDSQVNLPRSVQSQDEAEAFRQPENFRSLLHASPQCQGSQQQGCGSHGKQRPEGPCLYAAEPDCQGHAAENHGHPRADKHHHFRFLTSSVPQSSQDTTPVRRRTRRPGESARPGSPSAPASSIPLHRRVPAPSLLRGSIRGSR